MAARAPAAVRLRDGPGRPVVGRARGRPRRLRDRSQPRGRVRAFQRYVRYRRGFSLDATRRLDDEPNGIADASSRRRSPRSLRPGRRRCRELRRLRPPDGRRRARAPQPPARPLGAAAAAPPLPARAARPRVGEFSPQWRARHLLYTQRTRLPLVALRILQAEAYLRLRTTAGCGSPSTQPPMAPRGDRRRRDLHRIDCVNGAGGEQSGNRPPPPDRRPGAPLGLVLRLRDGGRRTREESLYLPRTAGSSSGSAGDTRGR